MKKYIATLLLSFPLIACAKDPNVKAYCNMNWKESTPGWTSVPSKHGVTIVNKSPKTLVYDVYFDNAIQYPKQREMPLEYKEPPYTPNAHQEHHFTVEPGKTLYYGEVKIDKVAGFQRKGRYKTKATTIVIFNGVELDSCAYYNTIDIN